MSAADRRSLVAVLEAIAESPVPPPTDGFVVATEERLRAVHAVGRGTGPARHQRPRLALRLAACAAAALIAAVVLISRPDPAAEPQLRLTSATDARVVLTDGTRLEATAGLALPDGAIIETGPNGSASAGGVRIGPNARARVADGALVPSRSNAPATSAPAPTPTTAAAAPVETPPTAPPVRAEPPTTAPAARPDPTTVPVEPRPEARQVLPARATVADRAVRVEWAAAGEHVTGYRIVGSTDGTDPTYPRQTGMVVLFDTNERTTTTASVPYRDGLRLVVVALEGERAVAISAVLTPTRV